MKRRQFIQYTSFGLGVSLSTALLNSNNYTSAQTKKLDKITYGTNWYAEAEHGGFYQAVATGIYEKYGLDVTIKMGGPQVNGTQLLMAGAVDFYMGSGFDVIRAIENGIPKVTVAAIFQKDPQVMIAHPGTTSLESLKGRPLYLSALANTTFWPFLKAKYGYTDDQKRPYNFSVAPFLADKTSAVQGYVSSEPLEIEKKGGFKPEVFLLADHGYTPYSTTIETRREILEKNPDLVQRFVDASIKGWYSYLENPAPGNELIKKDNPEMTDEKIAYGIKTMKEYGIIISGDAKTKGIGAMTEERWKSFFESMVKIGTYKADTDYKQAFTLAFINKGVDAYKV